MSMSDYELSPSDSDSTEFTIAGDSHDVESPYLTLQALDVEARHGANASRGLRADPYSLGAAPVQSAAAPSLADVFRGAGARARADAVRRALADGVEKWYRTRTLPPDALLRDGLLVLEAGYALDEAQRTLLARTALARGHGVFTALRHQTDPSRVATLVHEAIMEGTLTPNGLRALLVDDSLDPYWVTALDIDLRGDLASPLTALRAQTALNLIASAFWQGTADAATTEVIQEAAPPSRVWVRVTVAALLLAALALLWFWRTRAADYGDAIVVPAGAYMVSGAPGSLKRVAVDAFVIDRSEVTLAAYRACVNAGLCIWDAPAAGDPLHDSEMAQHPVTGVSWEQAQQYCSVRNMRLPSAAEWEVAASYAPATNRTYRFPWGEAWEPTFVIGGAENNFTGTAVAGSRSPQGDSPLGAADMAGNAAEWTSTPPSDALDQAIVKGGSFRDQAAAFQASASQLLPKSTRAPWLGFRCAAGAASGRP